MTQPQPGNLYLYAIPGKSGQRLEVQNAREHFDLDSCCCWWSSSGTEFQDRKY